MCGRFVSVNKKKIIEKSFNISTTKNFLEKSYNVAPGQKINAILNNKKELILDSLNWGYSFYNKNNNKDQTIINSRIETINSKFLFKDSFLKRKCIILANGYYEWSIKNNIKFPYFINIPDKEMIYFAGIWKYLNFKKSSMKVFSIITKPANKLLKEIHDRMPGTLSTEESKDYLDHNNSNYLINNVQLILEEYFEFFKISKFVNNPINNSSECIKPII